jgi:hypothetical protein
MDDNGLRLAREITLLYAVEAVYKIPAAPVVRQLIADNDRPLPDLIPPAPQWVSFEWPASGFVDSKPYWERHKW